MRLTKRLFLAVAAASSCLVVAAPPELTAVRVAQPPLVDGRLEDACWAEAPVATDFSVLASGGEERAFRQTAVRAVWDERALYLSAVCLEPLPATLSAKATARDGATWMDDAVEWFLRARPDDGPVFHFIVNCKGVLFDQRDGDPSFDLSTSPAAVVGEQAWTVELEIPWAELGLAAPQAGRSFGFNAGREHRPHDPEWSTWAPLEKGTKSFPLPALFGRLTLAESAPKGRVSALAMPDALVRNDAFAELDEEGKPAHWRISAGTRRVEIAPGSAQYALRSDGDYGLGSQTLDLPAAKGEVYTVFAAVRGGGGAQAGVAAVQSMADGRPDDLYPFWNVSVTEDFRIYTGRIFTDEGVERIARIVPFRSNKRGWVEFAWLQMVPGVRGVAGIDDVSHCTRPDERGLGVPAATPALPSFKPLPGGPLKALVFVGQYQRDVAELAQRLDLDYDLVYCPSYRGSGKVESAVAEDASRVLRSLASRRYGLVILAGRPSEQSLVDGIADAVRGGAGLVVVEPLVADKPARPEIYGQLAELFPAADGNALPVEMAGALSGAALAASSGGWEPVASLVGATLEEGRVARLTWRAKVPGLIPFEGGSGAYWEYRWALLARTALWAARRLPEARVVALAPTAAEVANPGTEPLALHGAWDTPDGLVGEFVRPVPAGGARLELAAPEELAFGRGPVVLRVSLRDARQQAIDFAAVPLAPTTPRIRLSKLELPGEAAPEAVVAGSVQCQVDEGASARLDIALTDAFGRVVEQAGARLAPGSHAHSFALSVRSPLSVFHRVVVTAHDEAAGGTPVVAARLEKSLLVPAVARTHLDDFQLGGGYAVMHILCQPYLLDPFVAYLRQHGMTACTVNQTLIERGMPAWGGTLSGGGMAHRQAVSTRPNCFSDPEEVRALCERTADNARKRRNWGYLGYNMHDEVHLSQQETAETCDGPACLAAFRAWAAACYGTIEQANAEWGTTFASFAEVGMPRIADMGRADNPARWVDYRLFMEGVWANAYAEAHAAVREACPDVSLSLTNPYKYGALSGTNFALWTPHEEIMLRYFHRHVADRCRSWSEAPMLAWIGYRSRPEELRKFMWEFAFQGGAMAIWWDPILPWAYSGKRGFTPWYMFDPLWRETERGRAVSAAALELERGLGRTLRAAAPVPPMALVLHSQASMHLLYAREALAAGKLTNRGTDLYRASDDGMARALQRQSIPYRYTFADRLEADLAGCRLVALPSCLALGEREVAALDGFVARGGRLLADAMPGTHTGHGRPLAASPLAPLFDGRRGICLGKTAGPEAEELVAALASLVPLPEIAVRTPQGGAPSQARLFRYRLGTAELLGIVQGGKEGAETALALHTPADGREIRDLRRGGLLGKTGTVRPIEFAPGDGVLLALLPYAAGDLSAQARVAGLAIQLDIRLAGVPADAMHVFRVETIRPGDDAPWHVYSRNVLAPAGAARVAVPLARNDPSGLWRIAIRDILTGATAECRLDVAPAAAAATAPREGAAP